MPEIDLHARTLALQERIAALPAGSLAMKKVNGKTYAYHRWTENKKRYDKYVPADQVDGLRAQIEERKALEEELRMVKLDENASRSTRLSSGLTNTVIGERPPSLSSSGTSRSTDTVYFPNAASFATNVLVGDALRPFASAVQHLPQRAGVLAIEGYLHAPQDEHVFMVTGLRTTGRTTMIRQVLARMNPAELAHTAFIQACAGLSMDDLTKDLRCLAEIGVKYIFINDATLFSGFIDRASILADFFTSAGLRIVLSSADPLTLMLVAKKRLYSRATLLSTTFLPFREAINIVGYQNIEDHLRLGGTTLPNTFSGNRNAVAYFEEAVIGSTLRARAHSEVEQFFGDIPLSETEHALRYANDILNKQFLSIVLNRFELPNQDATPEELLEYFVIDVLESELSKNEPKKDVDTSALIACLQELGLTQEIALLSLDTGFEEVAQKNPLRRLSLLPGLRYAGVAECVRTLLASTRFRVLPLSTRKAIETRLLKRVETRLLEDLVLLETKEALKNHTVTCVELPENRCGMVIQETNTLSCKLFIFDFDATNQNLASYSGKEGILAKIEHTFGSVTEIEHLTLNTLDISTAEGQAVSRKSVETYLRELSEEALSSLA